MEGILTQFVGFFLVVVVMFIILFLISFMYKKRYYLSKWLEDEDMMAGQSKEMRKLILETRIKKSEIKLEELEKL